MGDCLNGWKQWWLTLKLPPMKRLIQTTFRQHKKMRRRRQWNHFVVTLQTARPSLRWWASSQWGSWRELSLLRPLWCNYHTWRMTLLTVKKALIGRILMVLMAWQRNAWYTFARAVKDAQQDEKHCYHCSSPYHFIRDCPLVKLARKELNFNYEEGTAPKKGAQTPLGKAPLPKLPQDGMPKV